MKNRFRGAHFVSALALSITAVSSLHAADNATFIEPAAGSVFHVGEYIHVKLVLSPTDTAWGTQLFDFYIDSGLTRGDMGVTAGNHYADSMRQYITDHKEFDWPIPDSLNGKVNTRFGTVNRLCMIGTRPYPFTPNQVGAYGKSASFSVVPASSVHRSTQWRRQSADFSLLRVFDGNAVLRALPPGVASVMVLSVDGRIRGLVGVERGTMQAAASTGTAMVVVRIGKSAALLPGL